MQANTPLHRLIAYILCDYVACSQWFRRVLRPTPAGACADKDRSAAKITDPQLFAAEILRSMTTQSYGFGFH